MKAYRDDVRRHMVAHGRNPDDCKVLFLINPILGETDGRGAGAQAARAQRASPKQQIHAAPGAFRQGDRTSTSASSISTSRLPDRRHDQRPSAQPRAVPQRIANGPLDPRDDGRASTRSVCRSSWSARPTRRRAHGRGHGGGRRRRLPVLACPTSTAARSPRSRTGWCRRCRIAAWCARHTRTSNSATICWSSSQATVPEYDEPPSSRLSTGQARALAPAGAIGQPRDPAATPADCSSPSAAGILSLNTKRVPRRLVTELHHRNRLPVMRQRFQT